MNKFDHYKQTNFSADNEFLEFSTLPDPTRRSYKNLDPTRMSTRPAEPHTSFVIY